MAEVPDQRGMIVADGCQVRSPTDTDRTPYVLAFATAMLAACQAFFVDAVRTVTVVPDRETSSLVGRVCPKNVTSRYDGTALIAAAHLGHDGVVRQLIAAGAPLDHVNNLHWTAVIESIVIRVRNSAKTP